MERKRILRPAKVVVPEEPAYSTVKRPTLTMAKRRTPGQPVDLSQLRAKLSAASGGSIPLQPKFSNELVVERYSGKVKNRTTAIRAKCIDCSCGIPSEVSRCAVSHCALHLFRDGSDPFRQARAAGEDPPPTPVSYYGNNETMARYNARIRNRGTAIRAKCIECMNGQPSLVASCESTKCALHPFRMGSDPMRKPRANAEGKDSGDDATLEGDDDAEDSSDCDTDAEA